MGVKHFCIGWDVTILHAWWREKGAAMHDLLAGRKAGRKKAKTRGGNYR